MAKTELQLAPSPRTIDRVLKYLGANEGAGWITVDLGIEIGNEYNPTEGHSLTLLPSAGQEATDRLEDAAPEMFQACEDFTKGWTHFCDCIAFDKSNMDAEAIRFMNEIPTAIAAAINKAQSSRPSSIAEPKSAGH